MGSWPGGSSTSLVWAGGRSRCESLAVSFIGFIAASIPLVILGFSAERAGGWLLVLGVRSKRSSVSQVGRALLGIGSEYRGFPEVARPTICRRPGITIVRTELQADEIEVENGIPVTSAARTQFDLSAVLSRREMERVMNEAVVRELTSRLSLPHLLKRYPRRRGNAMLRELLAEQEPRPYARTQRIVRHGR